MTTCPVCKEKRKEDAPICYNCTFPYEGTEKERGAFIGQSINFKSDIEKAKKQMTRARVILTLLTAFQIIQLVSLLNLYGMDTLNSLAVVLFIPPIAFIITVIFLRKHPIQMVTLSLGAYALYLVVLFIADPALIVRGILWRIIIIGSLVVLLFNMLSIMETAKRSNYFMSQIFPSKKRDEVLDEIS
ncbi:MAG: hypothetical protein HWE14_14650 [Flavobacteriia bacterium]|nr:hypothetical protein [Flavobacteriia bacterium]